MESFTFSQDSHIHGINRESVNSVNHLYIERRKWERKKQGNAAVWQNGLISLKAIADPNTTWKAAHTPYIGTIPVNCYSFFLEVFLSSSRSVSCPGLWNLIWGLVTVPAGVGVARERLFTNNWKGRVIKNEHFSYANDWKHFNYVVRVLIQNLASTNSN